MPTAIFGIDAGGIGLFINLIVLFLVVTYLALVYWTYADAKRRIEDPVLITCAAACSLFFPFVGTVVYAILRPPEFLEDREERELELRAAEIQLRQLIEQSCPHCEYPIAANYIRCPNCERRLRNPCRKCRKPLDPKWGVCPYCETEVRKPRGDREREPGRRGDRAARPTRPPSGQRAGAGTGASRAERSDRSTRTESGSRAERAARAEGGSGRRESTRPPVRSSGSTRERERERQPRTGGSFDPGTDN